MSMPKFPEVDPCLSCDTALNMILSSIAMEELALSHIINAEGEKLQYMLGTLKKGRCINPSLSEITKAQQSSKDILDSVSQNQIILKNKMDKVIYALEKVCVKKPPKSCCSKCKCCDKFSAVFETQGRCVQWLPQSALMWATERLHGKCACIDDHNNTKIRFSKNGRFMVGFVVNARARTVCKNNVQISLQLVSGGCCTEVCRANQLISCDNLRREFTVSAGGIVDSEKCELGKFKTTDTCCENSSLELSVPGDTETIALNNEPYLLLKLVSCDSLNVESATLNVVEI